MPDNQMRVEKLDGATVVILKGEIDFGHSRDFGKILDGLVADNETNVVIDLAEAHFVGSAIIGLIVGCAGRMRRRGGELKVCSIPAKLKAIFEILGVDKFTAVFQDRTGALLASPEDVRKHLNIQDRRKVRDRRTKNDPVETTDKRAHERRKS